MPVLLIDDIFAELDTVRKKMILKFFEEMEQIIIVSTIEKQQRPFSKEVPVKLFSIDDGNIIAC